MPINKNVIKKWITKYGASNTKAIIKIVINKIKKSHRLDEKTKEKLIHRVKSEWEQAEKELGLWDE